ncbi:TetR/AcrR family transcriptional regulator [Leifsonia sp. 2TAF2]|uniref:TetR/AcrR family transcriptional regulator n=1 Tax=Leifsonia sp. 2TAF2 TaxID=3233009 RepID=UPI003F948EB6
MKAPDPSAKREYRMSARAASAGATAERIIDAMLARFATTPYEHIRLDDVAADAGVTVQTLIRRFGGKGPLMVAVVDRELGRIVAARESAHGAAVRESPDGASAGAGAAGTIAALVAHYEVYGALILKMYSEAPLVPGLDERAARGRAYHVDWCRRTFERYLDRGLDDETRSIRLAQIVVICDATAWRILRFDGKLTPAETERAVADLLRPLLAAAPTP